MVDSHTIAFDGALLERGFWLYVWEIKYLNSKYFYVGRTGDSSSSNASSPFNRLGMHLDIRKTATANCIVRLIREKDIDPAHCKYEMFAMGPFFQEQSTFEMHKPIRNIVGFLEAELAYYLKSKGFDVLGKHPKRGPYDKDLFSVLKRKINKKYIIR